MTTTAGATATHQRVALFVIVVTISTCILQLLRNEDEEGNAVSFQSVPRDRVPPSFLSSLSSLLLIQHKVYPQQIAFVMLICYMCIDLIWYHPDCCRHRTRRKAPTRDGREQQDAMSNSMKHQIISIKNDKKHIMPSSSSSLISVLKDPLSLFSTVSLDVAEDLMTMCFMTFILVVSTISPTTNNNAASPSLSTLKMDPSSSYWRNLNGMIYAIQIKIGLKLMWHYTTMTMTTTKNATVGDSDGQRQPSSSSLSSIKSSSHNTIFDWMETSYNLVSTTTETTSIIGKPASHPTYWSIHGHEYDIDDNFITNHPGGKEAILLGRGRDCTALFESYHSFSRNKMNRYVEYKICFFRFDWFTIFF